MKQPPFADAFRAVIAFMVLLLYAGVVGYMAYRTATWTASQTEYTVLKADPTAPRSEQEPGAVMKEFSSELRYIVTTVGALVSAVVIAGLATTKPGTALRLFETVPQEGKPADPPLGTIAYLIVWFATGLTALIVGTLCYPDRSAAFNTIGSGWLATAVATTYAYFGITPKEGGGEQRAGDTGS